MVAKRRKSPAPVRLVFLENPTEAMVSYARQVVRRASQIFDDQLLKILKKRFGRSIDRLIFVDATLIGLRPNDQPIGQTKGRFICPLEN